MTYKTVLTIAKTVEEAEFTFPVAAEIAKACDARLVSVNVVPELRLVFWDGDPMWPQKIIEEYEQINTQIEKVLKRVSGQFQIEAEWHDPKTSESHTNACLVDFAHYADLVVTNAEPGLPAYVAAHQPHEALIMDSGRPVLIVPKQGGSVIGQNATIAWKSDRSAARAVFDALPLLKRSPDVNIVHIEESENEERIVRQQNESLLALLERHAVAASMNDYLKEKGPIGETIFQAAENKSSGFVVMGAYGHSRFHESVLGGATRFALQTRPVPVLYSH